MPANRFKEEYLVKLVKDSVYSQLILDSFRDRIPKKQNISWIKKVYQFYRPWIMNSRERRFHLARRKGKALAIKEILKS